MRTITYTGSVPGRVDPESVIPRTPDDFRRVTKHGKVVSPIGGGGQVRTEFVIVDEAITDPLPPDAKVMSREQFLEYPPVHPLERPVLNAATKVMNALGDCGYHVRLLPITDASSPSGIAVQCELDPRPGSTLTAAVGLGRTVELALASAFTNAMS